MESYPKIIKIYITRNGNEPFLDWLNALKDARARAKIMLRLDRVRLGNLGDMKSVGGGVCELRVEEGPGYRIYFGQDGLSIVILLMGGDKSGQWRDIRKARELWAEYRSRFHEN